jgi:hypothetical protein
MGDRMQSDVPDRASAPRSRSEPSVPARPSAAGALALQRAIGNRATGRLLSRWAAHPDKDKKGVLMPDAMVAEFNKFNPPLSK